MVDAEANTWLLPNESVALSLSKARLEQRETFLSKELRSFEYVTRRSTAEMKAGWKWRGQPGSLAWGSWHYDRQAARMAGRQIHEKNRPLMRNIKAESLFVTNLRLMFVDSGSVVGEIIIDKNHAREAVRELGERNRRAMKEYEDAWQEYKKQSFGQRVKRGFSGKVPRHPAFASLSSLTLLKGAERKGVLHAEVRLDMAEIGGSRDLKLRSSSSRFVSGGHLTFSNMGELADRFISIIEPKFSAMSEYLDSGQASKDYEGGLTQPVEELSATGPSRTVNSTTGLQTFSGLKTIDSGVITKLDFEPEKNVTLGVLTARSAYTLETQLRLLKELHESGAITEEEYNRQKTKILGAL